MLPLKLKVYLFENDRKIEKFSDDQWNELTIIFEKLVRNLKEEDKNIKIENFNKTNVPYITMDIEVDEDDVSEVRLEEIASYLAGDETENPVYLEDKVYYAQSDIILDNEEESFLDRFNKLAIDTM